MPTPADTAAVPALPSDEPKEVKNEKGEACVVIDVKCGGGIGDAGDSDPEDEKVCRICHLSPDRSSESCGGAPEGSELIQLGCGCRGELGIAHRHCAEAWFRVKGNRCCEICGSNAKNVNGEEDITFMEEWHERRIVGNNRRRNSSERSSCWRGQPFCNFLMACLVIAFILPWFFRVNVF
ncbi:Zinc finger RING/FYVE/PHD-type protein [Dioscorea alata]|uniref:Zinc finger RING/FYVE/PHD-type protein n=1 Tax=Dioscorea alata TaxID=55571 RepID=A0ACB7W3E7_DIOAL|nr:Zinc finger RING/FYVE/PHD-type protein [Dioscorea alata]